jgi:hypothetical protein
MTIQEKAKSLYAYSKEKKCKTEESLVLSHGWLYCFRNSANLHNMNISGEAASADIMAAEQFLNVVSEITEGRYLPEHVFNPLRPSGNYMNHLL